MALDDNTIKILLVVMGLPYIVVTIFLLLVCFRSIADKFANWSDVYGDYNNYKWPDIERFQDKATQVQPDEGSIESNQESETRALIKRLRLQVHPKRAKSTRPVKARDPVQPEQQDNQDQVFSKRVEGSSPGSPLYFFETPGICQQTRFDSRETTDDSGRGIYGKRRSLSALEYLGIYDTPYYN